MQDLITAASIRTGARAFFYKCAFIASQKKHSFPFLDRVRGTGDAVIDFLAIGYDFSRYIKAAADRSHFGIIGNLLIDI